MEKCNNCQTELAQDSTVCPNCGKDNAQPEEQLTVAPVCEEAAPGEETAEEAAQAPAEAEEKTEEAPADREQPEPENPVAAAEAKEGAKVTPGKMALAIAAAVVLLAVLIALVVTGMTGKADSEADPTQADPTQATQNSDTMPATEATVQEVQATVPADGNPDDATCKGTYTVSDEDALAAKDTIVATIGDKQLTNGQLQVYYWSMVNSYLSSEYGYYVMMYGGIDYTQPLDTQVSIENAEQTWQQYFLEEALNYWQMNQALAAEAEAAGIEMSAEDREYVDNLATSLENTAAYYGLESVEELLRQNVGPGAGLEEFTHYQEVYHQGRPYYDAQLATFVPTQEDLEAFFTEHEEEYAASGITQEGKFVDVRHILLIPEGGTTDESGNTTYTDEEWAACEAAAQAILDEWKQGDATEESFAQLANTHSTDPGSNTNGGLYQQVYEGQMVEPFEEWCFDEARVSGDTGLVKTSYGWHIMYFVSSEPMWMYYAESDWVGQQANDFIAGLAEKYPMEVDYSAISLGYVNLAG